MLPTGFVCWFATKSFVRNLTSSYVKHLRCKSTMMTPSGKALTKDQFLTFPLATFINDNDEESNFHIAKNIVKFFEAYDDGNYAAIVSDKPISTRSFKFCEGKCRYDKNIRGKYIIVYKQAITGKARIYKKDVIEYFITGLILYNDNAKNVRYGLEELFDKHWSVIKSHGSCYYTYNTYSFKLRIGKEKWTIWRHGCSNRDMI